MSDLVIHYLKYANSVDQNQTPRWIKIRRRRTNAASDLGLHCLDLRKHCQSKSDAAEPAGLLIRVCTVCIKTWISGNLLYEPRHDKTNKMSVRPGKTQISLSIRPV